MASSVSIALSGRLQGVLRSIENACTPTQRARPSRWISLVPLPAEPGSLRVADYRPGVERVLSDNAVYLPLSELRDFFG